MITFWFVYRPMFSYLPHWARRYLERCVYWGKRGPEPGSIYWLWSQTIFPHRVSEFLNCCSPREGKVPLFSQVLASPRGFYCQKGDVVGMGRGVDRDEGVVHFRVETWRQEAVLPPEGERRVLEQFRSCWGVRLLGGN